MLHVYLRMGQTLLEKCRFRTPLEMTVQGVHGDSGEQNYTKDNFLRKGAWILRKSLAKFSFFTEKNMLQSPTHLEEGEQKFKGQAVPTLWTKSNS